MHLPLLRELGVVRPPSHPPEGVRRHAPRRSTGVDLRRGGTRYRLTPLGRTAARPGDGYRIQATTAPRAGPMSGWATRRQSARASWMARVTAPLWSAHAITRR